MLSLKSCKINETVVVLLGYFCEKDNLPCSQNVPQKIFPNYANTLLRFKAKRVQGWASEQMSCTGTNCLNAAEKK